MARMNWKSSEVLEAEAIESATINLRAERDRRLRASDWTQLPDAPLSGAKRAEWVAYRQALRELPEQVPDPRNPTWPEEPA